MSAPESVVLVVCPVCGRTDRFAPLSPTREHSAGGKRCDGVPEYVAYTRPPAPATDEHGEPWRRDDADELKALVRKTVLAVEWPAPPAGTLADDFAADEIWIAFTDGTAIRLVAFGHAGEGAELRAEWSGVCPDCHGTGKFPHDPQRLEPCATCGGTGKPANK